MNRKNITILLALAINSLASASCQTTCSSISKNLWQPRSLESYGFHDLMMLKTMYTTDSDRQEWQGTFGFTSTYMQSTGKACGKLGSMPFWSGTNTMTYGTNDGLSDFDVYQIGMGDVVGQGTITLTPKVTHVGGELLLHFTHDKENRGFFFIMKAPISAISVNAQLHEKVAGPNVEANTATNDTWLSYPSPSNRYNTLTQALQGGSTSANGIVINDISQTPIALKNGRFSPCKLTTVRLGDFSTTIGYNLYGSKNGFLNLGFKFTAPTSNASQAKYVLEPIAGRAGLWGVGGEMIGHYKLWANKSETRSLDFWMNGEVLHLAPGRRPAFRSFDLKQNGPGSKYLLLQNYFNANTSSIPSYITPAINVTTMPVISKFAVEGNISVLLDYHEKNWNIALGGEFWGRSKECLSIDCCNLVNSNSVNLNNFAVLGRQISDDARNVPTTSSLSLHLCEPLARINKSQPRALGTYTPPAIPLYPTASQIPAGVENAALSVNRIPANLNDALDIAGAAASRALSGSIFGQLGYTWKEHRYNPNFSIFASSEIAPNCNNSAINLWSAGVQGSINF